MTQSNSWKQAERWWASRLGGRRHPSQGTSHADISGEYFVAESKYRNFQDYSAEFRKAISQADVNAAANSGKVGVVCFTFHYGRGIPGRHFLLLDVDKWDRESSEEAKNKFVESLLL
jgi:hypothetical protein